MNYPQTEQKEITKSLPPSFEQLSSFEFGKLVIELNIEQLLQLNIKKFQFQFLGGKSPVYQCSGSKKMFEFPIKTTLWQFYSYLKDMGSVMIIFQTSNEEGQILVCEKQIQLLPMSKIMSKNYLKGNYIANSVELCDIYCLQTQQNKGYVMFKIKLEFDEEIHREVRDVVNFEQIMSKNPEQVNQTDRQKLDQLPSSSQLIYQTSSHSNKQTQLLIKSRQDQVAQSNPYNSNKGIQSVSIHANFHNFQNNLPVHQMQVKHLQEDESRMIEDDIDRLISEIQNKPYDSRRYQDSQGDLHGQGVEGMGQNPFINSAPYFHQNQFMNTQSIPSPLHYPSNNQTNSFISSVNQIPIDSRTNRFHPHEQLHLTQQSNRSHHNSKSPINNNASRKYPAIPLPNSSRNITESQKPFIPHQTIYSQHSHQRSVSPLNNSRNNRSLSRTQQSMFPNNQNMKSSSHFHSVSNSTMNGFNNSGNKGTLKIHIHELLGKSIDAGYTILRVYANNEDGELINCKGSQEGEVVIYNQKAELNECELSSVQKLRFELENYDGIVVDSCVFEMTRLINIPKLQGIFMLNLIPHNGQYYGPQLTASQTILRKLQHPPNPKTLRISLSFSQQLQVIQIYMNLSNFSLPFSKCNYKIPLTKQTVEFQLTDNHFNIFPHSKNFPKLMIEFWDDKAILGVCEVNLVQIKNITKNVLECNLEPIYLYDTVMPIKNIFTQNQVGKFKLLVCCGNVRQVQHFLNKNMLNRSLSMTEIAKSRQSTKTMIEVDYDKKLGVFIKDKKQKNEIQIQVDERELFLVQKQSLLHEKRDNKEEGQHEVSMMSENQFLACNEEGIKGDITLSKVHSIKLSQQEIEDDEDQDNMTQLKQKPSPQFLKKKSSNLDPQLGKNQKTSSLQQPLSKKLPPPPKPLTSLQSTICTHIKTTFLPLSQPNFQPYQELKKSCKPHLLFNFIDIDMLIKQMMELGINKCIISEILQILQPVNGMVNFNLLNDFMMCLEVEEEVKYNLVASKLFVKMALDEYYKRSCEQIQRQQLLYDCNIQADQKQWLSSKFLSQISTLDESIDFNQTRKLFSQISLKISMNEYTLMKNFFQNQKEIRTFLFEMAQSKSSYEQMIKNQKNLFEVVKLSVIEGLIRRKTEHELNKKYQQSILDKLYSSKMFQQSLSQSKVSEKESDYMTGLGESRTSYYQTKPEFIQTRKNYPSILKKQDQFIDQNYSFIPKTQPLNHNHYEQQDDDDFITIALNAKPQLQKSSQTKILPKQNHQFSDNQPESSHPLIPTHQYKSPLPSISLSQTGQTIITYSTKRTVTLIGLENCKTTCQCQLDMELELPYIKVIIESPYQKKLYFKESDHLHSQQFQVKNGEGNDDEEIQGTVTLSDVTKKGEIQVAAARFVVIKGIQSVYALKTLREDTFCGLVKIIIE